MLLPVAAFFAVGTGIELYGLKWVSDSISIINTTYTLDRGRGMLQYSTYVVIGH